MINTQTLNEFLFYARETIVVPSGDEDNSLMAGTALHNLSQMGFILDKNGTDMLSSAGKKDITDWYYEVDDIFKKAVGADKEYHTFYPDFPAEIIEKSELELFIDKLEHYWFAIDPEGQNKKTGVKSLEEHNIRVLSTVSQKEGEELLDKIFKNVLTSKQTPSENDMRYIVNPVIKNRENWQVLVQDVTNRDLLAYIYADALINNKETNKLPALVSGDYLRIARDISFMKKNKTDEMFSLNDAKKQNISSMPRSIRRFIATRLNSQMNLEEDVARNRSQFKALFKGIHSGEFKECRNLVAVSEKLRSNHPDRPLHTYYGDIENAFKEERYDDMVNLYAKRPGEFVKALNRMLSIREKSKDAGGYSDHLHETAEQVFKKTKVEDLVNLIDYLHKRERGGSISLRISNAGAKPAYDKKTAEEYIKLAENGIKEQLSCGHDYGKVYIGPEIKNFVMPSTIDSATKSLHNWTAGTRIPIEKNEDGEMKNIRLVLWFDNPNGASRWNNVVDISAGMFSQDENGTLVHEKDLAWYTPRSVNGCRHSGDWIGGEGGKAEYIDINRDQLIANGITHVSFYVNIWSGNVKDGFAGEDVCFGWMEREEMDKSEQFDPKAVKQYCKLGGKSSGILLAVLDLKSGEIVWMDVPDYGAKTESDMRRINPKINAYYDKYGFGDRPDMGYMAKLAIDANTSEIIDNIEEADTIFSVAPVENASEDQRIITAIDVDTWKSEFMTKQDKWIEEEKHDGENEKGEKDIEEINADDIEL